MIGEILSCGYCGSDAVVDHCVGMDNGVLVGSASCRCGREVLTVRCPDSVPLEFMDRFFALLDFEIEAARRASPTTNRAARRAAAAADRRASPAMQTGCRIKPGRQFMDERKTLQSVSARAVR
jgi:hypothetical protein